MNVIPVVDLSQTDYPQKIEAALRSTGNQLFMLIEVISHALGFFYIVNHGISLEKLSSFLSLGEKYVVYIPIIEPYVCFSSLIKVF